MSCRESARCFPVPRLILTITLLGVGGCSDESATDPAPGDTLGGGGGPESCETSETWAAGFQSDDCAMADGGNPPVTPVYWPDVCTPQASAGWTPSQSSFDQLSWRSFFNTSWPALINGQPDTSKAIGVQENGVFLPIVWELYKDAADLFADDGSSLTAADYSRARAVPSGCDPAGPRVLSMTSKLAHGARVAVAAAMLGGAAEDGSLKSIDQAFRGPLYPQGEDPLLPVYYEIRIDDTEYQAIIAAGAQNKSPAELNCTGEYATETCTPFTFPLESTEVKAAWKVLSSEEVGSGTFFYQQLQVQDPATGSCSVQPMGLVGLHIARKVSHAISSDNDGRKNSWAWATFEHRHNVPPVGSDGSSGSYSFFNTSCTPVVDAATCAAVTTPNPDGAYQCCENLYRYVGGTVPASPIPDQVTRIDPPPPLTQACNAIYSQLEKGVFDHYFLVTTQWPKLSDGPYPATVTPAFSRNAVIETYFTEWQSGAQVNTSSCMGCHSGGSAVDMSYLFLNNS